jgi:hypothetical protein
MGLGLLLRRVSKKNSEIKDPELKAAGKSSNKAFPLLLGSDPLSFFLRVPENHPSSFTNEPKENPFKGS